MLQSVKPLKNSRNLQKNSYQWFGGSATWCCPAAKISTLLRPIGLALKAAAPTIYDQLLEANKGVASRCPVNPDLGFEWDWLHSASSIPQSPSLKQKYGPLIWLPWCHMLAKDCFLGVLHAHACTWVSMTRNSPHHVATAIQTHFQYSLVATKSKRESHCAKKFHQVSCPACKGWKHVSQSRTGLGRTELSNTWTAKQSCPLFQSKLGRTSSHLKFPNIVFHQSELLPNSWSLFGSCNHNRSVTSCTHFWLGVLMGWQQMNENPIQGDCSKRYYSLKSEKIKMYKNNKN